MTVLVEFQTNVKAYLQVIRIYIHRGTNKRILLFENVTNIPRLVSKRIFQRICELFILRTV